MVPFAYIGRGGPRYWSISFSSSVISACIRIIVIEYWERGHWAVLSFCFLAHHFSMVISGPIFFIIIQLVKISIELLHFPTWHFDLSCFSCDLFVSNEWVLCIRAESVFTLNGLIHEILATLGGIST